MKKTLLLCLILCFTNISYAETVQVLVPIAKQDLIKPHAFSSEPAMKTVCVQEDCYYVVDQDTADKLVEEGIAESYEPVVEWRMHATPNDTHFNRKWELNDSTIGWLHAWEVLDSLPKPDPDPSKIAIAAIIDSGFYTHEDFSTARLYKGIIHYVSGWANGTDTDGHGSHVAGIIAADTNNAKGVASVSGGKVRLMPIKTTDGKYVDNVSIVEAINLVLQEKTAGAPIIAVNMSFGGAIFSQAVYDAIIKLKNAGIIVVASAGNERQDLARIPMFPASYNIDNIVAVASLKEGIRFSGGFSNYGGATSILAPGEEILSFYINNTYATASGTSMSAPFVTGMLATGAYLYNIDKSEDVYPDIEPAQLLNILYDSALQSGNMTMYAMNGRVVDVKNFYDAVIACREKAKIDGCTVSKSYPQRPYTTVPASSLEPVHKSSGGGGGCSIAGGTAWDWLLLALALGVIRIFRIAHNP